MEDAADKLLKQVHQSGFPFQIGVREQIERTAGDHGWGVTAEEYHWSHKDSGKSGFIDLIVEHQQFYYSLIIECKRVRSKDHGGKSPAWIFLTPNEYATNHDRLSGFKADKRRDELAAQKLNFDKRYWTDDAKLGPPTVESAYCIFEAQDEKSPMLERIADSLLPSVESAGADWLTHNDACNGTSRIFIPVVVTNATLYTCTFDASSIGMAEGNVPSGDFQAVPFIRFRKGLTQATTKGNVRDFKDSNRQQQKTMLIINAAELSGVLKQFPHR